MRTANVLNQRIKRVAHQRFSDGPNKLLYIELENGVRLEPVLKETDDKTYPDLRVSSKRRKGKI